MSVAMAIVSCLVSVFLSNKPIARSSPWQPAVLNAVRGSQPPNALDEVCRYPAMHRDDNAPGSDFATSLSSHK
jgi:hypothetical protein